MSKKPAPKVAEPELMKRANFFMPPAMLRGLEEVAKARGGKPAEHVRRAVSSYLKRYGTQV